MQPNLTHRELIRHLANKDSQTGKLVRVLESLQEPTNPKQLAEKHSLKREVVHEFTGPLEPWAVERSQNGARKITAAGEIARRAYDEASKTIDSDDLVFLSWSKNRDVILQELRREGPSTEDELSRADELPSKRTVKSTIEEMESESRNWIVREGRNEPVQLTIEGERVASVYEDLLIKMEQVIEKAPCLRDLELECADIPVKALADADIELNTAQKPFESMERIRSLADSDFQRVRAFQSYWTLEDAKAYQPALDAGKQFEAISPPVGFDDIPKGPEEVKYVVKGLRADNHQWLMYPDELPCGLMIFDENRMAIGARDLSRANQDLGGTIFTQNDELVDWAIDIYESYRRDADDAFDVSVGFSIGLGDLVSLLIHRYLDDEDPTD